MFACVESAGVAAVRRHRMLTIVQLARVWGWVHRVETSGESLVGGVDDGNSSSYFNKRCFYSVSSVVLAIYYAS